MNDLHRGDIYEAKISTAPNLPITETALVMILQNDAGEIPCQTVSVVKLKKRGFHLASGNPKLGLAERKVQKLDKIQLNEYVGRYSRERALAYVEAIEEHIGIGIPEIIIPP